MFERQKVIEILILEIVSIHSLYFSRAFHSSYMIGNQKLRNKFLFSKIDILNAFQTNGAIFLTQPPELFREVQNLKTMSVKFEKKKYGQSDSNSNFTLLRRCLDKVIILWLIDLYLM